MPRPYRPSNGTEGCDFDDRWCAHCTRDAAYRAGGPDVDPAIGCQILANVYAFDIGHPEYPKEWITDERGSRCTAFTTDPLMPVRCDKTIDMFGLST